MLTVYNKEHPPWEHSRNPFALAQHDQILPGSRRCCETVKLFKWNCRAFGCLKLETKPVTQLAQQNLLELSSESALSEAESSTDESAGNFPFGLGF